MGVSPLGGERDVEMDGAGDGGEAMELPDGLSPSAGGWEDRAGCVRSCGFLVGAVGRGQ